MHIHASGVECRASVSPREDVIFALSDDYLWIQFSFGSIFKVLLDVSTELEDGTVDLIEVAIHADGFDMVLTEIVIVRSL